MRRFSKLLFQAILTVLLFSGLGGALRAQTRPPIELALVPAGATFQTKGTAGYLFYAECSMDGQDQNWHFLPSMKLGNGSPVQWSFGTPEPGTPRQLYRIRISATGGYTAATAATQDTDGDSIPDMKEVENGTSPISADTDGDGVADDKEAANGTSPMRFDMPAFSIVSAWRKSTLWKNLSNTSQNPKVSDWTLKLEADGTAKGYITDAFWSSSSPSPASAPDPLDLSRTAAAFWTSSNYTAAVPVSVKNRASRLWGYRYQQFSGDIVNNTTLQSYGEVLERTICIKSSRLMPVDWRIPYAKISAAQKSFTEGWHTPGGQPSTPPTMENGFFTIKKGFDRSSEVTLSVADDGPSPVWPSLTAFGENRPGNAESRSLQILYLTKFGTKAGAGDADGDGVGDDLEKRMGLDPAKRNTDGMGYADGDQINQDILPPADGFRITTRAVSFIANVYSKDGTTAKTKDESLAAITDLPAATKFQYAKDQSPAYDLNKALQDKITALSPFPDKVPEAASWPLPDPISSLILYPQENPYDTVAFMDYGNSSSLGRVSGDQCRIWATIPEPVATATTRSLLKVREESPDYSGLVATSITPVTFTIPAGSTVSCNYIDLTAARPTTAATGPLAAKQNMSVRERLLTGKLTDTRDQATLWDDLTIDNWNTSQNISESNIAWIEAHTSASNSAPRMPQLEFSIPGLGKEVTIEAKLEVQYTRGNGSRSSRNQPEDNVKIPTDGTWKAVTGNAAWKIWQDYASLPFFGGEATLSYRVKKEGADPTAAQTMKFRIGGKNPNPAKARQFIETLTNAGPQGPLWFAYAIAKSESKDYNGVGTRYNQFWQPLQGVNDITYKTDRLAHAGRPVFGDDPSGPGGYGLFQVTGSSSDNQANIPRQEIWNWQENCRAAMLIIETKRSEADAWMVRQKNNSNAKGVALPSHTVQGIVFSEGTVRTMNNAVTMKAWNGSSAAPDGFSDPDGPALGFIIDPQSGGYYCYWKNSAAPPDKWALSRYNDPPGKKIKPFNYVNRVCQEVE